MNKNHLLNFKAIRIEGPGIVTMKFEPSHEKTNNFLTRSDTNRPVQPQKQARSLKFWVKVEEIFYYLCSENKGANQLCSYCTADLCLCFHLRILWFSHAVAHLKSKS